MSPDGFVWKNQFRLKIPCKYTFEKQAKWIYSRDCGVFAILVV